jgi:lipopolysaccharide transport system ATP-binding protein
MSQPAIRVEHLSKAYRVGRARRRHNTFIDAFDDLIRRPFRKRAEARKPDETFWALRDVSFDVPIGEVVGIIGRNGAGKSTLLKVLSRITAPTAGRVEIRGRVASLLEIGTGFHSELTGRENMYMNGSILGMTRAQIDRKFDEIVDFSGVERFLDTPLKRYSSGMQVRLAFAVAAHLEPEILIVDEVLAVGDTEFQDRCLKKMQEVGRGARTVLFVSHNMDSIRRLCRTGILIEQGAIRAFGECSEVINTYLTSVQPAIEGATFDFEPRGMDTFHIQRLECLDLEGAPCAKVETWDAVRFRITVHAPWAFSAAAAICINSASGTPLLVAATEPDHKMPFRLVPGVNRIDCTISRLMLAAGTYSLVVGLAVPNVEYLDQREIAWRVYPRDVYHSGLAPAAPRCHVPMDVVWEVQAQ